MPPGRPRQFNEAAVIEKAMEAFWRHGFKGIGIDALLKHMGISRQSLYNTFGDKRQLFIKTIEYYAENIFGPQMNILHAPASSADNIVAFANAVCDLAIKDLPRGCLISNTLVEMAPHDEEIAEKIRGLIATMEKEIQNTIERGQAKGEIDTSKDAQALAQSISVIIIGMAVASKISPPDNFFNHCLTSIRSLIATG